MNILILTLTNLCCC